MQAAVGDRLHVHGNIVGHPERAGEIIEVRGAGGQPPYLVRFDDGHAGLVFPARTRSSSIRAGRARRPWRKAEQPCEPGLAAPAQNNAHS
jgi:hypothetical protein